MRKKTGQTVTATLSSGTFYKDEIIKMGKYRSNPCNHEVRLVAVELGQPKERISVEMVFRGLYHFSRAVLRGESTDVVTYLVKNYKMLGLIKQERKRQA